MLKPSERAKVATWFVNIPGHDGITEDDRRKMEQFLLAYPGIRRLSDAPPPGDTVGILCGIAVEMRALWLNDVNARAIALRKLKHILFDTGSMWARNGTAVQAEPAPYPAHGSDSGLGQTLEPAIKLSLGAHWLLFQERDVLDGIARALFEANSRGYLRMCEGIKKGWRCPHPYLVADQGHRVHCYGTADGLRGCGERTRAESMRRSQARRRQAHRVHKS
jgi:hypothetical protein